MRFANPQAVWLLLPVAGALLLQLRAGRKRAAALARFARDETLPLLPPPRVRDFLMMSARYAALLLCVVALLRPQGEPYREARRGEGLDILIALDTSRSMLADDLRPNRLAAAKEAIERLAASLQGDRIGLILFAGSSFLACPLTTDYGAFIELLRTVDTEAIPRGGTSLAVALEEGARTFKGGDRKSRVLVVVSDGEEHEGNAPDFLQALRAAGVTLVTAGVGSEQGALIPLKGGYLKDPRGNVVKSRRNASRLRGLAEAAGGIMAPIDTTDALSRLYQDRLSLLPKREVRTDTRRQYREWFQIPMGIACILLLLELLLAVRKRA